MWQGGRWEEISHFNQVGSDLVGRSRKRRKGKREKRKERNGKWSEKLYLLSKIYRDRAVGFRRSKRQSSSTRQELRVGTRIWGFPKNPRGREFSYSGYF